MTLVDLQNFAKLHPGLAALTAGAFGACVGSFLNVCIHRLPKGESIVTPGSHCACGQPIPFWYNIPLLGWLLLRGRAKCCGAAISVRYPLVELITALLFVAAWTFLPPAKAAVACVYLPLLVLLAGCDLDDMTVPDAPNFALVATGIVLSVFVPSLHGEITHYKSAGNSLLALGVASNSLLALIDSLIGIAVGTALIWWVRAIGSAVYQREAMGEADIILCAGVGAYCGWQGAAFCLFGGSVVGVLIKFPSAIRVLLGKEDDTGVPFVPSMAIAGAIWFFRGPELVDLWLGR